MALISSLQGFTAHPDRRMRANSAALSTVGPTGAIAILDAERGQFYSINDVGGRVWELLRGETTFDAIVDQLCVEYDAARETIGADVARLLEQFASVGLVVTEGDGDDER